MSRAIAQGIFERTQISAETVDSPSSPDFLCEPTMQSQDEVFQPRDRRPWTEEEDEMLRMAIEEGMHSLTSLGHSEHESHAGDDDWKKYA